MHRDFGLWPVARIRGGEMPALRTGLPPYRGHAEVLDLLRGEQDVVASRPVEVDVAGAA